MGAAEWAASHGHVDLLKCMASAGSKLDAVVQTLVKSCGVEDTDDSDTSAKSFSSVKSPESSGKFETSTSARTDSNIRDDDGAPLIVGMEKDSNLDDIKSLKKVS